MMIFTTFITSIGRFISSISMTGVGKRNSWHNEETYGGFTYSDWEQIGNDLKLGIIHLHITIRLSKQLEKRKLLPCDVIGHITI